MKKVLRGDFFQSNIIYEQNKNRKNKIMKTTELSGITFDVDTNGDIYQHGNLVEPC